MAAPTRAYIDEGAVEGLIVARLQAGLVNCASDIDFAGPGEETPDGEDKAAVVFVGTSFSYATSRGLGDEAQATAEMLVLVPAAVQRAGAFKVSGLTAAVRKAMIEAEMSDGTSTAGHAVRVVTCVTNERIDPETVGRVRMRSLTFTLHVTRAGVATVAGWPGAGEGS